MHTSPKNIFPVIMAAALAIILFSCGSPRKTGFELQKEIWELEKEKFDTSTTKEIYITDTKPIDSIDVNQLIYDIFRVEADDYPDEVRLFARVYDSLGNFVTNMADPYKTDDSITYFTSIREELGKFYNIRKAPVDSFKVREYGANDSIPYSIVLSVDYSGSMDAVMDAIHFGTELFVKMKTPYDRIALTSFNKDLNIKVPLSQDTSTILNLYRAKLHEGQGLFSGVFDAMYNTIDILKDTPEDDPRMLVIFTDGDDNYSKADLDKLIPGLVEHDIHVFTVAFGYSKDDKLRQIAHFTGGRYYKAHTKEDLIAIFRDIYMSLKYFYKISYVPPRYVGYHRVFSGLNVPGRADSLIAEGQYDTSYWLALGDTVIKPILFDYNKATIRAESFIQVDEIVDMMMIWPKLRFEIQGHTDNIGGHEFNMELSERRAKAVFEAIVERGIDERRLRYRGFGFTRPRESNETDLGRQQNRRTEFIIIAK